MIRESEIAGLDELSAIASTRLAEDAVGQWGSPAVQGLLLEQAETAVARLGRTNDPRVLHLELAQRSLAERLRFTDAQRCGLARAAKAIPRHVLMQLPTIVTPDTLLRWFRKLVAAKYDSSGQRSPGRPVTRAVVLAGFVVVHWPRAVQARRLALIAKLSDALGPVLIDRERNEPYR